MFTARRRRQGLTLVEMVIFIVVVSIAVAGVLVVMNITSSHSGDAQLRKQATAIAEGILEEVEMARFTYCDPKDANATTAQYVATGSDAAHCASIVEQVGPESGNVRPYDNVNDYVAALGTKTSFALTDVNSGSGANQVGTYTAWLTISKAALSGMESDSGASANLGSALQIRVEVDYTGGSVILDGYRTQYSPNLMPVQ